MKTCIIKPVYEAIIRRIGLDPDTAGYSATQKANLAELVNERLAQIWESALWPEILKVEQRYYRATWDDALLYIEDDEVWYEDAYYKSLQDANTNHQPDTATDWWEEIDEDADFVRYIEFDQDGETEIDAIDVEDGVFDSDPRIFRDRGRIRDVVVKEDQIIVRAEQAPLRPWIRFRPVCPEFSYTEWSAATAYSIGNLCYYATTGESYKALAAGTNKNPYSEPSYWEPVYFPKMFKTYVLHAVASDLMTEDEGRFKEEAKANAELDRLSETMIDQQGLVRRACYRRS